MIAGKGLGFRICFLASEGSGVARVVWENMWRVFELFAEGVQVLECASRAHNRSKLVRGRIAHYMK
jgi:hypothetical protein